MTTINHVHDTIKQKSYKRLSSEQARQFVDDGYVVLRNAFDPADAAIVRQMVWDAIGLSQDKPEGWPESRRVHLRDVVRGPAVERSYSKKVAEAFDDVMGEGAWNLPDCLGWWPILFPMKTQGVWEEPQSGWHVDGIQFHHHLTSPEQGLLSIFIFSDCGPDDGGTVFEIGSHKRAAKILADSEPAGLSAQEICKQVNSSPRGKADRAIGKAGDVVLLHPFMNHTTGVNVGTQNVRFICNPCITLKQPMRLDRPSLNDHSLVELGTIAALADHKPASAVTA